MIAYSLGTLICIGACVIVCVCGCVIFSEAFGCLCQLPGMSGFNGAAGYAEDSFVNGFTLSFSAKTKSHFKTV